MNKPHKDIHIYHRFLDEAGDTTFYGKGKIKIVGQPGVSNCFILGMLKIKEPLQPVRQKVLDLQQSVSNDSFFLGVPSIEKKKAAHGFYFYAKDDLPEVRKIMFDFIRNLNCSFEAVVGRKIQAIFERKHNGREEEFYADLLSHLLYNKLEKHKLVLNIAGRGKSTRNANLNLALQNATASFRMRRPNKVITTAVVFNVQNNISEPVLNIADYFCWSLQRVFERGEVRFYDFLKDKIVLVLDLYDQQNPGSSTNLYTPAHPLAAQNKLSPPLP